MMTVAPSLADREFCDPSNLASFIEVRVADPDLNL